MLLNRFTLPLLQSCPALASEALYQLGVRGEVFSAAAGTGYYNGLREV
jgi:hypothetical protein